MSLQFRLTEPAIRDIEQIADRIAQQSGLERSEQFLDRLDAKLAKIVSFPYLGRARDEILPGMRSLGIDSYLILYMPIQQDLEVLRVVSGYQDLPDLFKDV